MATTSINNWNFEEHHVQRELDASDFINAASTLIAAGPPKIADAGDARLDSGVATNPVELSELSTFAYPIGVIENATISQNKALQRLFEIGSKRSYFVVGRTIGSVAIARTLFHGPSLLRVLYAYYPASLINTTVASLNKSVPSSNVDALSSNPGFADFFINMDSDLFDHPFGLLFYMNDSSRDRYGAFYLEDAYINSHQMNISSGSVLLAEGVQIQFDRAVPIDVSALTRTGAAALARK